MKNMKLEYRRLNLQSIDLDDMTFVFSYGFSLSLLREAIEKIGIINPPLVKEVTDNRYRIVCGYKRLLICREIGTKELVSVVLNDHIEDRDAFLISLYDNLSHRVLNIVEKSIIISKLQNYYSDQMIVETFLPLLGLNPHQYVLNKTLSLLTLDEKMRDAVLSGILDGEAALKLINFSNKDRVSIFEVLSRLRLSKSRQTEVIENLNDIIKRDGCSISDIFDSKELNVILDSKDLNTPQKGERVRCFIRRLRYPKLVKAEEEFIQMRKELKLGDRIKLNHPLFFEGHRYGLQLKFGSIDELKDHLKKIDSIKDSKRMKKLIEG
ncbi:MAG: ParB N-terminal domain-containing protein [Thermodesulfobacteriota bacterium]|nr:ParB N-terminal domain-containing protein [Thermodesulfobacteriota bacterium]